MSTQTQTKPHYFKCSCCGSTSIRWDASAYWDVTTQEYKLAGDIEQTTICENCGEEETAIKVDAPTPPGSFQYSKWRKGGWYVDNVRYPNGACGCVSRNYSDGKWRIACHPAPFEQQQTFPTRDAAALAEWHLAQEEEAQQ